MRKALLSCLLVVAVTGLAFGSSVTFQVNMSAQIDAGNFVVGTDYVDVAGSFNGWADPSADLLSDEDGDSIYTVTLEIAPGDIEYKFRINGDWDNADYTNREYTVVEGDNVIPVVWFRDYDPNAIVDADVYFYADMSIQLLNGNFDPDNGDILIIRGGFVNGWGGEDFVLTESSTDPGIYTNHWTFDDLPLDVANEFKYVIHKADNTDMWESADNRQLIIPTDHSYLDSDNDGYYEVPTDTVFFSDVGWDDVIQQDVTVYFQVNIQSAVNALTAGEVIIDAQTDADTIASVDEIAGVYINGLLGSWWDWGANPADFLMTDDGLNGDEVAGDGIYTLGYTFTAGQAKNQTYKYGINSLDNEAGFAENRSLVIDDAAATYYPEVDCFGEQNTDERLPFPEYGCATTVTFQVNMSAQIDAGNFDIATDSLDVAGSFNNWGDPSGTRLSDEDGDSIYTVTLEIDPGEIEYKYRINCDWGSAESLSENRKYTVVEGDNVIPVVWFANYDPNAIVDVDVFFYADMSIQLLNGNFDPDNGDLLIIRGGFVNGWSGEDFVLTESSTEPGIYTNHWTFDDFPLDVAQGYKYVIHKADGDMWESCDDRTLTVPTDHNYLDTDNDGYYEVPTDTVFFSNVGWDDVIQQDVTVYFQVNIQSAVNALTAGEVIIDAQTDADTIASVDEIAGVYINGLLGSWWNWGANPADFLMTDDGLNGDEVAGDGIYTLGYTFTAGQAKEQVYKYGINSLDNEAGFGENRSLVIDDAAATYYPEVDCFGEQNTDERLPFPEYGCPGVAIDGELSALPTRFALHQNFPNPFNPTTQIAFEMPVAGNVRLDIYNILGQKVRTLVSRELQAGFHVYEWDALSDGGRSLAAGVYVYQLTAGDFVQQKKMLLLK